MKCRLTLFFETFGYAKLAGGKNDNKPYLFIAGFNQNTYDHLPITLTSGRLPKKTRKFSFPIEKGGTDGCNLKQILKSLAT